MIFIVNGNRELLVNSNGNSSWSGATMQSYNTNATSWALAKYLYKTGARYAIVPFGLLIGAGAVAIHRVFAYVGAPYLPCCWYLNLSLPPPLTPSALSLSPRFEASRSQRSICPSSSNTPALSLTMRPRLASSSVRLLPGSSPSSTSETIARVSSRTTRTWSLALSMVLASRYSSSCLSRSLALGVHLFPFLHGGATTLMLTTIIAL
jgi:hypothetical protein